MRAARRRRAEDNPRFLEILEERVQHERELREMSVGYEHALTAARDHEQNALANAHQIAHQREHEFNEKAIEAASTALSAELRNLELRIIALEQHEPTFMTLDRFDREHRTVLIAQAEDHSALTRLLTQIGTLRGIVTLLSVPGIAALVLTLLAAATGHTVTGPGGVLP